MLIAPNANSLLKEAKKYLQEDNKSMALAKLLDAADLNNPEANFLAALFYFTGTGIQRNLADASKYATKYIELEPKGKFVRNAKEIVDGTVGTENAKRLIFGSSDLYEPAYSSLPKIEDKKKPQPLIITLPKSSNWKIFTLSGIFIFVIILASFYFYSNQNNLTANHDKAKINSNEHHSLSNNQKNFIDIEKIPSVIAPKETSALLTQMLLNFNQSFKLIELKKEIESIFNKPESGDVKQARALNQEGLNLFRNKDYENAYKLFLDANRNNPADIEVINNIAYALIKLREFRKAEELLGYVLSNSPGRTSAWANLGEVYSALNKNEAAIAAFIVSFNFSSNREKTMDFMNEIMLSAEYEEDMKKNIATVLMILREKK